MIGGVKISQDIYHVSAAPDFRLENDYNRMDLKIERTEFVDRIGVTSVQASHCCQGNEQNDSCRAGTCSWYRP
jgi:hypothetical protein